MTEVWVAWFDEYLSSGPGHGDDDRERWLAGHGPDDEEEQIPTDFGDGLLAFGRYLSDYYGITRERVELGKGARV